MPTTSAGHTAPPVAAVQRTPEGKGCSPGAKLGGWVGSDAGSPGRPAKKKRWAGPPGAEASIGVNM